MCMIVKDPKLDDVLRKLIYVTGPAKINHVSAKLHNNEYLQF